jgi:hypothetical protein
MKQLYDYLTESFDDMLKLSDEDKKKLIELDKKFNDLADEYEKEHIHFANVTNSDEVVENILKAIKEKKEKYDIGIKYEKSKIEDDKWCDRYIKELNDLKLQFIDLGCYLTKFYIYRINKIIEQILFFRKYLKDPNYKGEVKNRPSKKMYFEAIKLLKENPFEDIKELEKKDKDYKQIYTPEQSKKILQKEIDKLGYGWEVVIDGNMVPRMSVRPYREFRINANNNFSKVDLESLKVHEIAVHVARKYNALQSGLYLFIHGLKGNNVYDEGLAIYNSLNKVDKQKPNILFFICMKIVILYELHTKGIYSAYKKMKEILDVDDRRIALAILRASRIYIYTPLGNYSTDEDYLDGYLRVKKMSEKDRERLLELPIGPDQLYELDTLEKFIKINNFEPIKTQ